MTDDREDDVRAAQADMDATARDMERKSEAVEDDIEASRRELDELRDREGEAAGDVAGDWRETEDEAGGEDPRGAGRSVDVEREE